MQVTTARITSRPQDTVMRVRLSDTGGLTAGNHGSSGLNAKTTALFEKLLNVNGVCGVKVQTDGATTLTHIIVVTWDSGRAEVVGRRVWKVIEKALPARLDQAFWQVQSAAQRSLNDK